MKKHKILTAAVLALCIGAMPLQVLPCSVPVVTVAEDSETPETIEYNGMTFEVRDKKTVNELVLVSYNEQYDENEKRGSYIYLNKIWIDNMSVAGITHNVAESLSKHIIIPDTIEYIDAESVENCERVSYNSIGGFEFTFAVYPKETANLYLTSYNGNEEDLTIPETVDGLNLIGIKQGAFQGNTTIKNVTLPDTMEYIESDV
ncbi:MAG: hypothetical protein IKI37_10250, partial [Oscillospiraceae bacterium]|nr:hypothetical protein [Oscillospiraceae bacterium]